MFARGGRVALAVGTLSMSSALVALSTALPARATTFGCAIEGIDPADRFVPTLDGHAMALRSDGGWAYNFVVDGGCRLTPVRAPRGYYERFPDGGWSVVEFRPDGGTLRMWPVTPRGY